MAKPKNKTVTVTVEPFICDELEQCAAILSAHRSAVAAHILRRGVHLLLSPAEGARHEERLERKRIFDQVCELATKALERKCFERLDDSEKLGLRQLKSIASKAQAMQDAVLNMLGLSSLDEIKRLEELYSWVVSRVIELRRWEAGQKGSRPPEVDEDKLDPAQKLDDLKKSDLLSAAVMDADVMESFARLMCQLGLTENLAGLAVTARRSPHGIPLDDNPKLRAPSVSSAPINVQLENL
jgi:hypothetical protein